MDDVTMSDVGSYVIGYVPHIGSVCAQLCSRLLLILVGICVDE